MTKYEQELLTFRTDDEMQGLRFDQRDMGYGFIPTASHGYLVVPKGDKNYHIAKKIAGFGYVGKLAIYLEEDCEAGEFITELSK